MNKRLAIFADFVQNLSTLSKCQDRHVACIICDNSLSQVLSIGVNGGAKGSNIECLCHSDSKYSCIHAEANALVKLHNTEPGKVLICSLQPCSQCASMIVNEPGGFAKVLYLEPWKEMQGLSILHSAGIVTGLLNKNGEILFDSFNDMY